MPRAIDVIFNSIEGRQTSRKYVVESDRLNDFQVSREYLYLYKLCVTPNRSFRFRAWWTPPPDSRRR